MMHTMPNTSRTGWAGEIVMRENRRQRRKGEFWNEEREKKWRMIQAEAETMHWQASVQMINKCIIHVIIWMKNALCTVSVSVCATGLFSAQFVQRNCNDAGSYAVALRQYYIHIFHAILARPPMHKKPFCCTTEAQRASLAYDGISCSQASGELCGKQHNARYSPGRND